MHRGWIKVWRKTLESDIWTMPPLHAKVFIWILLMADHKTGVCKTSIQKIAEGVEWEDRGCPRTPNKRTILRILDWLQDENLVSRLSNGVGNARYTELSIINWGVYQNTESSEVTAKVTQSALKNAHYSRSRPKNLEERTLETTPMSAVADSSAQAVEQVAAHYKTHIHPKSRLLESGKKKVKARLGTFKAEELIEAIDHFRDYRDPRDGSAWWMENNACRGFDWFFESDKRIDQFRNLPVPSENGKAHHPQATCPDHGQGGMRREAWAGKLVLKCQTCEFAYRTEALWTDRPQSWEKDLK